MSSKYSKIIELVFERHHRDGDRIVRFSRDDLVTAHDDLGLERTKNIGDIPYSFRFRRELPASITSTAPDDSEWIIVGTGHGSYAFRLAAPGKILPSDNREKIPILDATPEIVRRYAPGTDEQALLTRARYNRLVDLFLGLTCYSVQNHLRTTVTGVGQIEVDEIYVGVNRRGTHFVLPCQAKSPGDRFGIVQVLQDVLLCEEKYAEAICRPIAMQFQGENEVALLELSVTDDGDILQLNVVDEKHYRLCFRSDLSEDEIVAMKHKEGHV